jgi:hypothetical protein
LPGTAVRRTESLPLAYDPAIHLLREDALRLLTQAMDARGKSAHDERCQSCLPSRVLQRLDRGGEARHRIAKCVG